MKTGSAERAPTFALSALAPDDGAGDHLRQAVIVHEARLFAARRSRNAGGALRLWPARMVRLRPETGAGTHVSRRLELVARARRRVVRIPPKANTLQ